MHGCSYVHGMLAAVVSVVSSVFVSLTIPVEGYAVSVILSRLSHLPPWRVPESFGLPYLRLVLNMRNCLYWLMRLRCLLRFVRRWCLDLVGSPHVDLRIVESV